MPSPLETTVRKRLSLLRIFSTPFHLGHGPHMRSERTTNRLPAPRVMDVPQSLSTASAETRFPYRVALIRETCSDSTRSEADVVYTDALVYAENKNRSTLAAAPLTVAPAWTGEFFL